MIFIDGNLKYDTDKMELISDKTKVFVKLKGLTLALYKALTFNNNITGIYVKGKIYKSKKSRYIEVYNHNDNIQANPLSKRKVKKILKKYDYLKYEELFGKFKEA